MPAGLVKFIKYACGASSCGSAGRPRSSPARSGSRRRDRPARWSPGRARRGRARRARRSGVASRPPTRMAAKTKSAALHGRFADRCGSAPAWARRRIRSASCSRMVVMVASRASSMSYRATSVTRGDPVAEQGLLDVGGAESAAAEDAELHATITFPPASRHRASVFLRGAGGGDEHVDLVAGCTAAAPPCRETSVRWPAARSGATRRSCACLIGASTAMLSSTRPTANTGAAQEHHVGAHLAERPARPASRRTTAGCAATPRPASPARRRRRRGARRARPDWR